MEITLLFSDQRALGIFNFTEPSFGSFEILLSQPEKGKEDYFIFKIQQNHHPRHNCQEYTIADIIFIKLKASIQKEGNSQNEFNYFWKHKIYFEPEVNKNTFKTICIRKKMLYICPALR
jgi:hypothetical protein